MGLLGLMSLLRGAEPSQASARRAEGHRLPHRSPHTWQPRPVEAISRLINDVQRVTNPLADQPSITIDVDGVDIN